MTQAINAADAVLADLDIAEAPPPRATRANLLAVD